jgi:hypothetical protein
MIDSIRRIRTLFVASGLVASSIFLLQVVAAPWAEARCNGSQEIRSTLSFNGTLLVEEEPAAGTCNGNAYYDGWVRSNKPGWQAYVYIQNNGVWVGYPGLSNSLWASYAYHDSNSHSYMNLCLTDGQGYWLCGWGNDVFQSFTGPDHRFYGVNYGF